MDGGTSHPLPRALNFIFTKNDITAKIIADNRPIIKTFVNDFDFGRLSAKDAVKLLFLGILSVVAVLLLLLGRLFKIKFFWFGVGFALHAQAPDSILLYDWPIKDFLKDIISLVFPLGLNNIKPSSVLFKVILVSWRFKTK